MDYDDIKTPEELLKFMDIIKYGIINDNINEWVLEDVETILKEKRGICFDQVELERDWFLKHGYKIKTYFMIFELSYSNDLPTHTFLVYEKNNKFYYFEHAFEDKKGIYEFDSINEIMNFVKDNQIRFANVIDEEIINTLNIYEYDKPPSKINFSNFLDFILN